ncbi:hypothetical protein JOQ06_021625 [Pogonophryne albipinna]|uniref:FISNA domain-containing protein n=1 Tax=Pogonophryne albipinna TaxID=1090488 RepID=A0AAD6ACP3_9TELE|nr:hypothetical protein JOQ06_021625 [Pogonophryne albipinna]
METTDPKIPHEGPDPPGPGPSCVSMKSENSLPPFIKFKDGEHDDSPRIPHERPDSPGSSSDSMKSESTRPPLFEDGEHSDGPRVHQQRSEGPGGQSAQQHQTHLDSIFMEKFQCVLEGIAKAGNPTLLNQIYTELYITEGGSAEVNAEHEVRQIETASRKPHRPETTIRREDLFKASPGRDAPIRAVMTKGVAGIGKTVLTQKFTSGLG